MSKYDALSSFLRSQTRNEIRFEFSEIENGIGFKLPLSARKHPAWWANNNLEGRQCMSWLNEGWETREEGWETRELDLASEQITFVKSKFS